MNTTLPVTPIEGAYTIPDFRFTDGSTLPELRLHYTTFGTLQRDTAGRATNAVLILHGTGGSGSAFLRPQFAGELFGPGQLLDAEHYFIILPDGIGHGASSKPSDGLRAVFPRYGYADMVAAQHALATQHLGIDRLRLVMGTSMGGMQTWYTPRPIQAPLNATEGWGTYRAGERAANRGPLRRAPDAWPIYRAGERAAQVVPAPEPPPPGWAE
jgi:homoserine acetyltransferase